MLQLFRVLLPSWRFFDGTQLAPELFVRTSDDGQHFTEWALCIPKIKERSWTNLWLNPHENFLLASHALLEYLKNDFSEEADPATSLALVENLVRYQLRESKNSADHFRFMMAYPNQSTEPIYLSPTLSLSSTLRSTP